MLKCLFATCLTALSVNTQPLAVSPSLVPSNAISEDISTDINIDDEVSFLPVDTIRLSNGAFADIQYQYGSNEVDNTDYTTIRNSLINGNMYKFVFNIPYVANSTDPDETIIYSGSFYLGSSIGLGAKVNRYNENINASRLSGRTFWHTNNASVFFVYYGITLRYLSSNTNDLSDITITLYASFPNYDNFYFEDYDVVISECPKQFIPYNVIAIHQSENLYNIFYNFFFGMFDNTGLTQYELELMGVNTSMAMWLAHTFTIISFALLFVVAIIFLRWLFRVVGGLILLKR